MSRVPRPFLLYKKNRDNKFSDAPGRGDGLVLGKSKGNTPFGQEFKYTDATQLSGKFTIDGKDYTSVPWHRRLLRGFKRPIAWAVVEQDDSTTQVTAHMMPGSSEVKVSSIGTQAMIPIYDENVILAMDHYEKEQESSPASTSTSSSPTTP